MTKLYIAKANVTGGRNGHAETSDGSLKLDLATPGAPNAKPGTTNPEQLFACGYAACFGGALEYAAKMKKVSAAGAIVNSEVALNQDDSGFSISVVLNVTIPGMAANDAAALVQAAHQVCPYSKATHGNIQITLRANDTEISKAA